MIIFPPQQQHAVSTRRSRDAVRVNFGGPARSLAMCLPLGYAPVHHGLFANAHALESELRRTASVGRTDSSSSRPGLRRGGGGGGGGDGERGVEAQLQAARDMLLNERTPASAAHAAASVEYQITTSESDNDDDIADDDSWNRNHFVCGASVRVKPHITAPSFGWGQVKHDDVGVVMTFTLHTDQCTVSFPPSAHSSGSPMWQGVISEVNTVYFLTLLFLLYVVLYDGILNTF